MNETSAETRRRGHRVISPVQIGLSQAHNDLALLNIEVWQRQDVTEGVCQISDDITSFQDVFERKVQAGESPDTACWILYRTKNPPFGKGCLSLSIFSSAVRIVSAESAASD